jgi:predicted transcriptional regulator of viral defense system
MRTGDVREGWKGRVAAFQAKQLGLVTRSQAREVGASDGAIQRLVDSGAWIRVHPNVFALASVASSWQQKLMAAYLWAGEGTCVSHRSACRLHELEGIRSDAIELSTPNRRSIRPGIKIYRVNEPLPHSRNIANMETTDISRTLLDLCAVEPSGRVELALDDALRRGLVSLSYLERRLDRITTKGLAGAKQLRKLIVDRRDIAILESALNTKCWRVLQRSKVLQPIPEYKVFSRRSGEFLKRLDFGYPSVRVGVEGNSRRWHTGNGDLFDYETSKHNLLTEEGWLILYFRWRDLEDDGRSFLHRLDDVLLERLGAQRLWSN